MSTTPQWYMAIGGQQVGPVTEQDVVNAIRSGSADATTLVFVAGMQGWTPLRDVAKFQPHLPAAAPPPPPAAPAYAPPSVPRAHEIDYRIEGEDLQFVEIELDPGESVVAEAGALMYMTAGIQMETIFGDGSGQNQAKGLMGALLGAGKRILTGESLFMTVFTAQGGSREKVAFAAPFPGRILPMDLAKLGASSSARRTRSSAPRRASRSASPSRRRSAWASSAERASSCSACRATGSRSSTRAAC